jgi:hypothetical protein
MKNLEIEIKGKQLVIELDENLSTKNLLKLLPIKSKIKLWGEEVYFYIDKELEYEELKEVVCLGDFAYWPEGPALCIFLGRTPISKGEKIIPASPVVTLGKVKDYTSFKINEISEGDEIIIEEE